MCSSGLARSSQLSTQPKSIFYFPLEKHWVFAPILVGFMAFGAHTFFDRYREDPTFKPSFIDFIILVVPIASFANGPARILHQSFFVLQTFIVAFTPISLTPKMVAAIDHQHFTVRVISCQSSSIVHLQMFLLDSVREALPIWGSTRVHLIL